MATTTSFENLAITTEKMSFKQKIESRGSHIQQKIKLSGIHDVSVIIFLFGKYHGNHFPMELVHSICLLALRDPPHKSPGQIIKAFNQKLIRGRL